MSTSQTWQHQKQEFITGNRNLYRLAYGSIAFGLLLQLLIIKMHFSSAMNFFIICAGVLFLMAGLLLATWAKQESAFIRNLHSKL